MKHPTIENINLCK